MGSCSGGGRKRGSDEYTDHISFQERKRRITEINKSIKSLQKQIQAHIDKIKAFKNSKEYELMSEKEREGRIKHWESEIRVFQDNILKEKMKKKNEGGH